MILARPLPRRAHHLRRHGGDDGAAAGGWCCRRGSLWQGRKRTAAGPRALGMSAPGIRAHMLRILFETILPVLCTGQKHPPNGASFGSVPSYVDIVITQNALTGAPCRACRMGGRSKGATEFVVAVSFIRERGAGGCVRKPILARLGNPKENPVRHKRRSNSC